MAAGSQGFDKSGVERREAVGTLDECNGTDVPTSPYKWFKRRRARNKR